LLYTLLLEIFARIRIPPTNGEELRLTWNKKGTKERPFGTWSMGRNRRIRKRGIKEYL
jgi:hypothetical protein